ncbi:hypothetical protein THIOM_001530 [Candidatus Thiomargarita nelsonii]|uniref:Uncharacterized protein n=1 Tax=Candidatus Thiomargarita nelsonii TaxID=1003181 RepID=A0A176S3S7_9GAMM|nr:hypothetical protein THIOM_001530 [Candidatus Thiomargarita nelsonii]
MTCTKLIGGKGGIPKTFPFLRLMVRRMHPTHIYRRSDKDFGPKPSRFSKPRRFFKLIIFMKIYMCKVRRTHPTHIY